MVLVNETLNMTITFTDSVIDRTIELVGAPYYHKDMLWITLPLIISLFLMQLYFARYRKEELGWNTAVGNSLALIFVAMDLFRHVYVRAESKAIIDIVFGQFREVAIIVGVGFISLWLLFGEFFHLIPKRLAFYVSSSLPTTLIAYLGIVLIYTNVSLDFITFIAGVFLFILLAAFFRILHIFTPYYIAPEEIIR